MFVGAAVAALEAVHVIGTGAALVLQRPLFARHQVFAKMHIFVLEFTCNGDGSNVKCSLVPSTDSNRSNIAARSCIHRFLFSITRKLARQ